jgi:hypothetical protein
MVKDAEPEKMTDETRSMFIKIARDDIDAPFAMTQAGAFRKAETIRTGSRWIGILGVVFFLAGYTPAIIFVVCLAQT